MSAPIPEIENTSGNRRWTESGAHLFVKEDLRQFPPGVWVCQVCGEVRGPSTGGPP